jgi:hypothetical protein
VDCSEVVLRKFHGLVSRSETDVLASASNHLPRSFSECGMGCSAGSKVSSERRRCSSTSIFGLSGTSIFEPKWEDSRSIAGGRGREVPHIPQNRYSGLFSYSQCGHRTYRVTGIAEIMMAQFCLQLASCCWSGVKNSASGIAQEGT